MERYRLESSRVGAIQTDQADRQDDGEPADHESDDEDAGEDGPESDDIHDAAARPATRAAKSDHAPPYPRRLDPIVERHVADYNQAHGFKPGDAEYLDPDLVRAIIRQEAGHDANASVNDPMQVNKSTYDWDPHKAKFGLKRGVAPGFDLGIKAGIGWLGYKSYRYDKNGKGSFLGWPQGVAAYNQRNEQGSAYSRSVMRHLADIKEGR